MLVISGLSFQLGLERISWALEMRKDEEEASSFGSVAEMVLTGGRWEEEAEMEKKRRESNLYGDLKREKGEAAGRGLTITAQFKEGFGFHLIKRERGGGWGDLIVNQICEDNAPDSYNFKVKEWQGKVTGVELRSVPVSGFERFFCFFCGNWI